MPLIHFVRLTAHIVAGASDWPITDAGITFLFDRRVRCLSETLHPIPDLNGYAHNDMNTHSLGWKGCVLAYHLISSYITHNDGEYAKDYNRTFARYLRDLVADKTLAAKRAARVAETMICSPSVCPVGTTQSELAQDTAHPTANKAEFMKCMREVPQSLSISSPSRRLLSEAHERAGQVLSGTVAGLRAQMRAKQRFSWEAESPHLREVRSQRKLLASERRAKESEKEEERREIRDHEPHVAGTEARSCRRSAHGEGTRTRCSTPKENVESERTRSQRRGPWDDVVKAANMVAEIVTCFDKNNPAEVGSCFFTFVGEGIRALGQQTAQGIRYAFDRAKAYIDGRALAMLESYRRQVLNILRDIITTVVGAFGISQSQAEKARCEICNNKGILAISLGDFSLSSCSIFMEEAKKCPDGTQVFAKLFSPEFISKVVNAVLDVIALIPALLTSVLKFMSQVLNSSLLGPLVQLSGDLAFVVQFFITSDHLMETFSDLVQVFDDFEKNLKSGFGNKGASFNRAPYAEQTAQNMTGEQLPGCTSGRDADGKPVGKAAVGKNDCSSTNALECGCDVPPPPCTPSPDGRGVSGAGCPFVAVDNGGAGKQATGCPADGLTPRVTNADTGDFVTATANMTSSKKAQCTRRIRIPLSKNQSRVNAIADAMGLPAVPKPFGKTNGTQSNGRRLLRADGVWRRTFPSSAQRSGAFAAWGELSRDWAQVQAGGQRILQGAGRLSGVRWARRVAARTLLAADDDPDGCRASDDDPFRCCNAQTYKSPYECCRGLTLCLTPLTSDRAQNLNWTKAQEWMRGDWKKCPGLRQPGEVFTYTFRRPLHGWDFLRAHNDTSAPATTRVTSGMLQWLRFPGDRIPDNELLCFLFNFGSLSPWWFSLFILALLSPHWVPYTIELLRLVMKCIMPDPNYAGVV